MKNILLKQISTFYHSRESPLIFAFPIQNTWNTLPYIKKILREPLIETDKENLPPNFF